MGDTVLTVLSLENHNYPFSMDSSGSSSQEDLDFEMNRQQVVLTRPPDINLPLSAERSPTPQLSNSDLDVRVRAQIHETENFFGGVPKVSKKCAKRVDSIWGAWFFFSFYFRPVFVEKSKKAKNGVSGFDKSDLQLNVFMVQHDLENMYMWVFKDKPENALGKMQLRSYMNGHSRQGESPFPFSADKGFVRSHRMQRKHYRGLSNPQCVHGIEVVPLPNLTALGEDERRRWVELTGRELNFTIPPEASDYGSWRNLQSAEFEQPPTKKLLNGSGLNLSNHSNGDIVDLTPVSCKRKKDCFSNGNGDECHLQLNPQDRIPDFEMHPNEPHWLNEFSGIIRDIYGPVTAAKSIYEDEKGYLIIISLPFVDLRTVKVSWRNTLTNGIIKVSCVSTSRVPFIMRQKRTFKLVGSSSEHCPQGEFVREIPLSTRIPEDANIEAYFDESGTALEILVPKLPEGPEEHEVHIRLRPDLCANDFMAFMDLEA